MGFNENHKPGSGSSHHVTMVFTLLHMLKSSSEGYYWIWGKLGFASQGPPFPIKPFALGLYLPCKTLNHSNKALALGLYLPPKTQLFASFVASKIILGIT
jgi:hypothetical protein